MKLLIIVENNKIFIHEISFKKNPNHLNKEIEKNENKKSFHFKDKLFFSDNRFIHSSGYLSSTLDISILKSSLISFVNTYTEDFSPYDSEGVRDFFLF